MQGGPFTTAEHVDAYLETTKDDYKSKTSRMRDEVTYARDTSSSLPRNSNLFRIMGKEAGKRKLLTPEQFAKNLKILLGKKSHRNTITIANFRQALQLRVQYCKIIRPTW